MELIRNPIVLVHGMGGCQWGPYVRAFFLSRFGLPSHFYPSSKLLVARLPPFASIERTASVLESQIDEWASQFYPDRELSMHLIGHSMGGLDSRLLIHKRSKLPGLKWRGR